MIVDGFCVGKYLVIVLIVALLVVGLKGVDLLWEASWLLRKPCDVDWSVLKIDVEGVNGFIE